MWIGRRLRFPSVLVASCCATAIAHAQAGIVVRVQAQGQSLGGALIALVASNNAVLSEVLSPETGITSFNAPPGEYRVRVRRIGFRPYYSAPVTLPRQEPLILTVESPRIVFDQMTITVTNQCGRIAADTETLSTIWEEASKALKASQLTRSDLSGIASTEVYRREVAPNGIVLANEKRVIPGAANRPFGTPAPESLIELGYVRGSTSKGWEFFGPDEAVLLSDGFASTHCFRAVRDSKKAGQIGVSFAPVKGRRQSDIEGVIWVDEQSSELRDVEFRFVNAGELTRFKPGGFSRFRRMPSGAWIVSEWELRMPRLTEQRGLLSEASKSGYFLSGGKVVLREPPR